jgi:TonB family protein
MLLHPMNVMRSLLSLILLLFLTSLAGGQDQETRPANPITREQILASDRQRPTVLRTVIPAYPAIAAAKRISGVVLVDVDIDPKGNVIEARAIIGGKYLRDSARKAALRWQFNASDGAVRSVRLTFIFHDVSYVAPDRKPDFTSSYQVEIERVAER